MGRQTKYASINLLKAYLKLERTFISTGFARGYSCVALSGFKLASSVDYLNELEKWRGGELAILKKTSVEISVLILTTASVVPLSFYEQDLSKSY